MTEVEVHVWDANNTSLQALWGRPNTLIVTDVAERFGIDPAVRIDGRYELVRRIGAGGMGEVWEARDTRLDAPVAIKWIAPTRQTDSGFLDRFRRESAALARIRSSRVVRPLDVGEAHGRLYLVTELLEGESLRTKLDREKSLPSRVAASFLLDAAQGLAAIHRVGLVHRDVSPANLFVVKAEAEGERSRIKVIDLGIAKPQDGTDLTTSGALLGTPAFMSPEQARGEEVDARSDVWSLGAVLFRMVTGRNPFAGQGTIEVALQICTGSIPLARDWVATLPVEVESVFERAFARNREFRFATPLQLAEAFAGVVGLESTRFVRSTLETPSWRGRSLPWGIAFGSLAMTAGVLLRERDDLLPASVPAEVSEPCESAASASLQPTSPKPSAPTPLASVMSPEPHAPPTRSTPRTEKSTSKNATPAPVTPAVSVTPELDPVFGVRGQVRSRSAND